ncbi:hypothetical protein [Thalassomonas viridans]|uniref:hypothetical protein n=1 Tax=Thalassomonas viridans TaxID=137584 RepID=UPI0005CE9FB6|nr:hypothetical protein [Thalassomonas viridans]
MKAKIMTIADIPVLAVRKQGAYQEAAEQAWQGLMSFCYGNKLMSPAVNMPSSVITAVTTNFRKVTIIFSTSGCRIAVMS